jgi:hypothetical protein
MSKFLAIRLDRIPDVVKIHEEWVRREPVRAKLAMDNLKTLGQLSTTSNQNRKLIMAAIEKIEGQP